MPEQDGPTFFCIYSGREWPAEARSLEHIVPFALGGSDRFTTRDVARKVNNDLGHRIDAPLLHDLRVVLHRQRLGIESEGGHVPSLVLHGTASVEYEEVKARLSLDPDGNMDLHLFEASIIERDNHYTIKARRIDEVPKLIERARARAERSGKKVVDVGEIRASSREMDVPFTGRYDAGICDARLSMLKIAIGAGHYTLGYSWSKSTHADRLRSCLHAQGPDVWNDVVVGPPFGVGADASKRLWSVGPDAHVIGVYNQSPTAGLFCVILLFGELLGAVRLADSPWPGQELPDGGTVFVIDCRSRALTRYGFDEFAGKQAVRCLSEDE